MMQKGITSMFTRSLMRAVKPSPLMMRMAPMTSVRVFGHTKYTFDDEDWEPNVYQLSE